MHHENKRLTSGRSKTNPHSRAAGGSQFPARGEQRLNWPVPGVGREQDSLAADHDAFPASREPVAAGELVVSREHREDALILRLSGRLDRVTSSLLERELNDAQTECPLRLVVDLTALEFVDAAGPETLVRARQRARENGQRLYFSKGRGVIQRLLALASSVGSDAPSAV